MFYVYTYIQIYQIYVYIQKYIYLHMYVYMHVGDSVNGSTAPTATSRSKWYRKSFPEKGFQIYCALLSLIMGSLGSNGKTPNFSPLNPWLPHEQHGRRTRFASHLDSSMSMRNEITGILVQLKTEFARKKTNESTQTPSTKQMVFFVWRICCIQPETWGNDERYEEFCWWVEITNDFSPFVWVKEWRLVFLRGLWS